MPAAETEWKWCFMSSPRPSSVWSVSMSLCLVTTLPVFVSITSEHDSADTNTSTHYSTYATCMADPK